MIRRFLALLAITVVAGCGGTGAFISAESFNGKAGGALGPDVNGQNVVYARGESAIALARAMLEARGVLAPVPREDVPR